MQKVAEYLTLFIFLMICGKWIFIDIPFGILLGFLFGRVSVLDRLNKIIESDKSKAPKWMLFVAGGQVSEEKNRPPVKVAILVGLCVPILATLVFYIMGNTISELAFWISMTAGWLATVIILKAMLKLIERPIET